MKSKEELEALKKEVETVNEKLQELTPEEPDQVTGLISFYVREKCRIEGCLINISRG